MTLRSLSLSSFSTVEVPGLPKESMTEMIICPLGNLLTTRLVTLGGHFGSEQGGQGCTPVTVFDMGTELRILCYIGSRVSIVHYWVQREWRWYALGDHTAPGRIAATGRMSVELASAE